MPNFFAFNDTSNPAIIDPSDDGIIEIDSIKSVQDQLIETMQKTYTKDKLSKQIKFNAIVLLHFTNNQNTAFHNAGLFKVKARIPELHCMIPTPEDLSDIAAIILHPTFIGKRNLLSVDGQETPLTPGTKITVTFGNMDVFSDPQVISINERYGT